MQKVQERKSSKRDEGPGIRQSQMQGRKRTIAYEGGEDAIAKRQAQILNRKISVGHPALNKVSPQIRKSSDSSSASPVSPVLPIQLETPSEPVLDKPVRRSVFNAEYNKKPKSILIVREDSGARTPNVFITRQPVRCRLAHALVCAAKRRKRKRKHVRFYIPKKPEDVFMAHPDSKENYVWM